MLTANGETFGIAAVQWWAQAACMGFRKQPIGRLHFKVAKGEIITANTKLSMASGAVITEHPESMSSSVFHIYRFVYQSITL